MAPIAFETTTQITADKIPHASSGQYKVAYGGPRAYNAENEEKGVGKFSKASHPNYLPTWDFSVKYPALEPFEHYEHGRDADASFPNLLKDAKVVDVTGNIGAEVHGVQLSKLSHAGKDELALFVAQKKVVAFRNQDCADIPIPEALEIGKYFGRLHIHPTSGAPKDHPEVHIVHRGAADTTASTFFAERITSTSWHTDVSYEHQPPGTTFLYALDIPAAGGDTVFSNMVVAYERLSPEFQKRLHGLKVLHSALEQANNSTERGGVVRRDAVANIHPLVRTHPATGEKALYINKQFSRRIINLKKEESDYLLDFLYAHIANGADFQCRMKWAPGTVVVWDNRVTTHSAILDWEDGQRRHIARITPQAERPYETPFEEKANGTTVATGGPHIFQ